MNQIFSPKLEFLWLHYFFNEDKISLWYEVRSVVIHNFFHSGNESNDLLVLRTNVTASVDSSSTRNGVFLLLWLPILITEEGQSCSFNLINKSSTNVLLLFVDSGTINIIMFLYLDSFNLLSRTIFIGTLNWWEVELLFSKELKWRVSISFLSSTFLCRANVCIFNFYQVQLDQIITNTHNIKFHYSFHKKLYT